MKRWFAVFELTLWEQRVILVLLVALVAATAITLRRAKSELENQTLPKPVAVQSSPSPGIRP